MLVDELGEELQGLLVLLLLEAFNASFKELLVGHFCHSDITNDYK